jgi:hypothetical protein
MRRIAIWTGVAVLAAGCQQAPVTKPRILSVQTPAGVPPAAPLNTTRNNPLIVPTAPVGTRTAVVAPAPAVIAVPQPPPGAIAPPAAIPVPAVPGVQGTAPPNTIAPGAQYVPPPGAIGVPAPAAIVTTPTLKPPAQLPGPVSDSKESSNNSDQ